MKLTHKQKFKNLLSNTKYKYIEKDIMELYELCEQIE